MPNLLSDNKIGAEIRRIRKRMRMSQDQFAKHLGLKLPGGQTQVSAWENGRGTEEATLRKIADLAGVDVSVFYEPSGELQPISTAEAAELRALLEGIIEGALTAYSVVARATVRTSPKGEGDAGGERRLMLPGEATRILQRAMQELMQAVQPPETEKDDSHTSRKGTSSDSDAA